MRMLTENLTWKLLSVAVAMAVWWSVAGVSMVATTIPVNVEYRNVPPDLEISNESIERLFLNLQGPSTRVGSGSLNRTRLLLDLEKFSGPGEQTITIDRKNLSLPAGVKLLRAVPSQVRVKLEKRQIRNLPIEVQLAGPPPAGYRIVSQDLRPSTVRVVGPESRVEQISSAHTDAIDLGSRLGSSEFRVPVYLPDPQVRFTDDVPIVTVKIKLEKIQRGQP